jgi:hypothetical protein
VMLWTLSKPKRFLIVSSISLLFLVGSKLISKNKNKPRDNQ